MDPCGAGRGTAAGEGSLKVLCGRLIDGRSPAAARDAAVVVEGERLIDAHVHLLIATDDYQVDHLRRFSAHKALRGLDTARRLLEAGWTSLRIAGDAHVHFAHLDVKTAIEEGLFTGPRLTGAGHYLSITRGGGDAAGAEQPRSGRRAHGRPTETGVGGARRPA